MNILRVLPFAGLLALLSGVAAPARADDTPSAPAGEKLYVAIASFDPIQFKHLREGYATTDDLVATTLKNSAVEQARFAGYPGEITVLDEGTAPPPGASVLTLTWNDGTVAADLARHGRSKYLGIVSRRPLAYHPDYERMQRTIASAGLPAARHDAAVRAGVQMNLYLALQYLVRYEQSAAKSG